MTSKRFKQKTVEGIYQEKTTNPLRKIMWSDLVFAGWGGSVVFVIVHAIFKFNILAFG